MNRSIQFLMKSLTIVAIVTDVTLFILVLDVKSIGKSEARMFVSRKSSFDFNSKVSVSAEAYMSTKDLIKSYGYGVETHSVETSDGYNLTLFRIPPKTSLKNKGAVILQHGYICDSDYWLLLKNKSLPYLLSNEGYDVWLGNARDTKYSRHKVLTRNNFKYWDFSYHEIGYYDVPSIINHILNATGEKELTWIGHSMGTTSYFIAMDLYPELQKSIKNAVLLAPMAYTCHMRSPVKYFDFFSSQQLETIFKFLSGGRTFPSWLTKLMNKYGPKICARRSSNFCFNFFAIVGGPNPMQFDREILHKAIGHVPADASSRAGIHYLQGFGNDDKCEFRRYDFGFLTNFNLYGHLYPPKYNLSEIQVPTLAMYGNGDWLCHPKDAEKTIKELQNVQNFINVQDPSWAHFDFVFAKDAPNLVYKKIIDFLSGF